MQLKKVLFNSRDWLGNTTGKVTQSGELLDP